ncbi:MAG: helix-turn-helix domain-containing protein [Methanomicrobiales archaeon]
MDYKAKINLEIDGNLINYKFFDALKCISETWSQRKAANKLNISHAVLNRRIKDFEEKLNIQVVKSTPRGSALTPEGMELLKVYERYENLIKKREKIVIGGGFISSNLVSKLASEYGLDCINYFTDDKNAVKLFNMDILDILTLDDPIYAFKNDLEFNPIAYDHLSLINGSSKSMKHLRNLNDLDNKKFLSIPNSSQRLAWNTLDNANINYEIVDENKTILETFKNVKERDNLYTFLNASFFRGSDILKKETKHIISLIIRNQLDKDLTDFLDYILNEGQSIVEENGFERVI